jgi:DNA-binding transcriptional regulator YiaG
MRASEPPTNAVRSVKWEGWSDIDRISLFLKVAHQHFLLTSRRIMSTKIVDRIFPSQCRAARALVELTQAELATAAGIGLSTVVDFEKARRDVSESARRAIRDALERAGVKFIGANGGGPGVRLRK